MDSCLLLTEAFNCDLTDVEQILLRGFSPDLYLDTGETVFTTICNVLCKLTYNPTEQICFQDYGVKEPKKKIDPEKLLQVLELMLKYGAKCGVYDNDKDTCLHIASRSGDIRFVEMFVNSGADIHILNHWGENLLHTALMRNGADPHDMVEYLIGQGLSVNFVTKSNHLTPIQVAVSYDHILSVRSLIQHGAKVDLCDKKGNTTLMYAFTKDAVIKFNFYKSPPSAAIINILLQHLGPNQLFTTNQNKESILHYAAQYKYTDIQKLLCNASVDIVNKRDNFKNVPLHMCFEKLIRLSYTVKAVLHTAEALIESGALLNIKNHSNETPICIFSTKVLHNSIIPYENRPSDVKQFSRIICLLFLAGLNLSSIPNKTSSDLQSFLARAGSNSMKYLMKKGFINVFHIKKYLDPLYYPVGLILNGSEVISLQDLAARVIRLNLWPNAIHGVKHLQIPNILKDIVVPEYNEL